MNVNFPIVELLDRYTIARLKCTKTNGANLAELEYYQSQIKNLSLAMIKEEIAELQDIHEKIWMLESELKSGREHEVSLEELGRRAIEIRDHNRVRVTLKNRMADLLGQDTVREIKQDHLSQ